MVEWKKARGKYKRKRYPDGSLGYLHRWVWEQKNNRKVPNGYIVHHKNGNKRDNRPQNLEIVKPGPHTHAHENYFLNKKTKASIKRGVLRRLGRRTGYIE